MNQFILNEVKEILPELNDYRGEYTIDMFIEDLNKFDEEGEKLDWRHYAEAYREEGTLQQLFEDARKVEIHPIAIFISWCIEEEERHTKEGE